MTKKSNDKIVTFLLFFIITVLLFNDRGVANSIVTFSLDVGYAYTAVFLIQIIALIYNWGRFGVKIDAISIMLFVQIIILTIGLLVFPNSSDGMKYYLSMLSTLIVYLFTISSNVGYMINKVLKLCEWSAIIIAIQTIYVTLHALFIQVPYYMLKSYIHIPIGQSNYIASFLIMFLVLIINLEKNNIKKFFLVLLILFAIILTRSSAAMLLTLAFLGFEITAYMIKSKKIKAFINYVFILVISIVLLINGINAFPEYFGRVIRVATNLFSGGFEGINSASNSRFDLYIQSLNLFSKSPIIGYGVNFTERLGTFSHNFILDQLLKGGLVYTLLYLYIICNVFNKAFVMRKRSLYQKTIAKVVVISLINSMYEPTIGTFVYDFFFWIICGTAVLEFNYIRKHLNFKNQNSKLQKAGNLLEIRS